MGRYARLRVMSTSSLNQIPTKKFVAGDEEKYETCVICLDDFEVGDELRILPCNHVYHTNCVDPWLLQNLRVCPQCRKKVDTHEDSESDTEDEHTPLLAGPRQEAAQAGPSQLDNSFLRAARRLGSRCRGLVEDESYGDSSEGGDGEDDGGRIVGNQLLSVGDNEEPRVRLVNSPTFDQSADSTGSPDG